MTILRICKKCGLVAEKEDDLKVFVTNHVSKHNKANICKPCAEKQQKKYRQLKPHKTREREYRQKEKYKLRRKNKDYQNKYGITLEEYDQILLSQNGCCKICKVHHTNVHFGLVVDHNHLNGQVRGLLCGQCNTGLGNLKDSIEILETSIQYLRENGSYAVTRNR